jgi:hypothetical protein
LKIPDDNNDKVSKFCKYYLKSNRQKKKKLENLFSSFFLLSRSAVEGMDGSERKEKNE